MRRMQHLLGASVLLLLAAEPIVAARIVRPRASASSSKPPVTAAGADRASLQELTNPIHDLVEAGDPPLRRTTPREQDDLRRLYRGTGYSPLWLDSEYLATRDADDALALLRQSADEGLEPADYFAPVLARGDEPAGLSSAAELAASETALSAAMLRYLRHVHEGRLDPRSIGFRLNAPDDNHDFAAILRTARAEHRITATAVGLTPQLAQYRELRSMLGRYRSLALAARDAGQLPLPTGVIRPGDVYQDAPALQRLLVAVGDLVDSEQASDSPPYYSGALVEGIQRFQRRHGLQPRPGPRNALGLIKFVFPNEENVYLHGTPAPELFSSERRDFSHGCVRVQDPVALAQWVLEENSGWTRDRILAATGSPVPIHVQLVRPVQVILFYTTAAVMEDGAIAFAEDIYHHDARLDRALSGPR